MPLQLLLDFVYAVWLDRLEGEALDEFLAALEPPQDGSANTRAERLAFAAQFGEIG